MWKNICNMKKWYISTKIMKLASKKLAEIKTIELQHEDTIEKFSS